MVAPTTHTYDTEGCRGTPIPLYAPTFIPLHPTVCGYYSPTAQRSGIVDIEKIKEEIAPGGVMRVAVSAANKLLVSKPDAPDGVSPFLAKAIAKELGVKVEFKKYATPAAIAEAGDSGEWDVCFIGADPARSESIFFTEAYAQIEAAYLVPDASPITALEEVDQPGVKIAAIDGAAWALWLDANIKNAEVKKVDRAVYEGAGVAKLFASGEVDVMAGLRSNLLPVGKMGPPGGRALPGSFFSVQQAVGCKRTKPASDGAIFLRHFVEVAKENGMVQAALDEFGVAGKLTVAGQVNTKIGGSTVTIYGDQRVPRYYWGDEHVDDGWPK